MRVLIRRTPELLYATSARSLPTCKTAVTALRPNADRGRAEAVRTPIRRARSAPEGEQVDHEDQRLVRRDRAGALGAVGEVRGDDHLAPAADPHAGDALPEAGDDFPLPEPE